MEQYLNQFVCYTGGASVKTGLVEGKLYPVSHTYSNCVAVEVKPRTFASVDHNKFEIVPASELPLSLMTGEEQAPIKLHSVLTMGALILGVRFKGVGNQFFDMELDVLDDNVGLIYLASEYPREELLPFGALLKTQQEHDENLKVLDLSQNATYRKYIEDMVLN